jgi:hypothetical protein
MLKGRALRGFSRKLKSLRVIGGWPDFRSAPWPLLDALRLQRTTPSDAAQGELAPALRCNAKAALEIALLHEKIDILKTRELLALTEAVCDLSQQRNALSARIA